MQEWYYSADGQQRGPVSLAELQERARTGKLDAAKDLVWNAGMTEWLPAGRVPEIFSATPSGFGSSNPYAPPVASTLLASPPAGVLHEIEPGSQPLDAVECLKRAFTLVNRNLKPVLAIFVAYVLIYIVIQVATALLSPAEQGGVMSVVVSLIGAAANLFFALGAMRVVLNVASGDRIEIAQLMSGGPLMLRALGAFILFYIMFLIGFMLLIVPGIIVAVRFSQFLPAIVDKNLGVIESLKYSAKITRNSGLQMFLLFILVSLVALAGVLALVVGLFYAYPVIFVSMALAYRWLQYGPVAVTDEPGTQTPVLQGRTPASIIG